MTKHFKIMIELMTHSDLFCLGHRRTEPSVIFVVLYNAFQSVANVVRL